MTVSVLYSAWGWGNPPERKVNQCHAVGGVCIRLTVCPLLLLLLLCHHLLLLLLGRLLGDDLTWEQLLLLRRLAGHVSAERMDYSM